MKSIVVGIEGSGQAMRAVDMAADLAHAYACPLTIVHVIEPRRISDPERRSDKNPSLFDQTWLNAQPIELAPASLNVHEVLWHYELQATVGEEAHGNALLEEARRRADSAGATKLKTAMRMGDPAKEIMALAHDIDADLIVLGRRGMNPIVEFLLGGVAQKVLHHAPNNVLLVGGVQSTDAP